MFLTNKKLCFHSYFNESTIFGRDTRMVIPLDNIKKIIKTSGSIIFNNSIQVITKEDKEIIFTSFMYREQAYHSMLKATGNEDVDENSAIVAATSTVVDVGSTANK